MHLKKDRQKRKTRKTDNHTRKVDNNRKFKNIIKVEKKDRKNLKGQIILKLEKSRRIERSVKNWQNIVEFVTRKELIQIS